MATSDEFDGDLSLWTEVDPSSAGTFSTASGQLQLVHAASNDTDLWTDQKDAPRLIQAVTAPLDIAVKLAAVPAEDGGYGIAVFDSARTNLVRLDYFTNGGTTNLFFAHVNAGANEIGFNGTVAGNPLYLRIVMPDADSAEAYTSADGETWTLRDTLDLTIDGALTAAEAGPYGSGAFSPFPGETYLYDWVRFDLQPGGGGGIAGTLAVTEAADTLAASGTHTPPPFTGTLSVTEQADSLAAAGTATPPSFTGTLAVVEQDATLAATGAVDNPGVSGTVAVTEAADTLSAAGVVTAPSFTGTLAVTEVSDTLAASGTVVNEGIAGSLSVTEAADILAGVGTFDPPAAVAAVTAAVISVDTVTAEEASVAIVAAAVTSTATVSGG